MTYCFKCLWCGYRVDTNVREPAPTCKHFGTMTMGVVDEEVTMQRDYRAENVGVNVAELKSQRERGLDGESGRKAQRDVFLPTMSEFVGAGDPTGEKGMREWNDSHAPRETNKRPLYPDVPKRSFAVS